MGKARDGHEGAAEELAKIVRPASETIWVAYHRLDQTRGMGLNGPEPIQMSEIVAYFSLFPTASQEQRELIVRCVQAMDMALFGWRRERQKAAEA